MPDLRDLQRDFARFVLFGETDPIAAQIVEDGIAPTDRLEIYRNTARIGLTEALRLSFPAINRLVGEAFFEMAAARFVRAHPPRSACLDQYGADFPGFLAALPESAGLRYLPDVARFEWMLSMAAHAPDATSLDFGALAQVPPEQLDRLRFVPHPSVTLLRLEFPADQIADAVLSGDDEAMAAIDLHSLPIGLVVHRGPDGLASERVALAVHEFLQALFAGEALGALLVDEMPDFGEILARQFTLGRIIGFKIGELDTEFMP